MESVPEGGVRFDLHEQVVTLTLDRPDRRNAMSMSMWAALAAGCREATRLGARALIVTGAGPHFSSGMDLRPDSSAAARAAAAIFEGDRQAALDLLAELKAFIKAIADCPMPTIAAIEGVAVGGGFEIALACDIRVAAVDARIGLPEARLGMIPDLGGCARLARLIGPGRAAHVICSCREYGGAEAFAFGMLEELTAAGEALARASTLAARIAQGGPEAIRLALSVVRQANELSLDEALALETRAGASALVSGEGREGLHAFFEKRAPRW